MTALAIITTPVAPIATAKGAFDYAALPSDLADIARRANNGHAGARDAAGRPFTLGLLPGMHSARRKPS